MVANCRDEMARSFSLTFLPIPGILISLLSPALAWVMEIGAYPMFFSFEATADGDSASMRPRTTLPARSRTW